MIINSKLAFIGLIVSCFLSHAMERQRKDSSEYVSNYSRQREKKHKLRQLFFEKGSKLTDEQIISMAAAKKRAFSLEDDGLKIYLLTYRKRIELSSLVAELKYDFEYERINNPIEQEMGNAILKDDKPRREWLTVNQQEDQFVNAVEEGNSSKVLSLFEYVPFKQSLLSFDWLSFVLGHIKISSSEYRYNKKDKQREKYADQLSIAYYLAKKELVKVEKKHLDYFNKNVQIDFFDIGMLVVIYDDLEKILKEKASIAKANQE